MHAKVAEMGVQRYLNSRRERTDERRELRYDKKEYECLGGGTVAPKDLDEVSGCGDLLRLMRFQSG